MFSLIISSFWGILRGRIRTQLPAHSPSYQPGDLRGDLGGTDAFFAHIHYFLSDNFDQAKHENGEVSGG